MVLTTAKKEFTPAQKAEFIRLVKWIKAFSDCTDANELFSAISDKKDFDIDRANFQLKSVIEILWN